jgi:hypothetical protein
MSHLDGKITSGRQPNDLPVEVGGAGSSGLQEHDKDWDAMEQGGFDVPLGSTDTIPGPNPQGDNPSFDMPAFADGQDVRKTYVEPKRGA